MRTCACCKRELELEQFTRSKDEALGRSYYCYECAKLKAKNRRAAKMIENPNWYCEEKEKYRNKYPHKMWGKQTIRDHKRNGYIIKFTHAEFYEFCKDIKCCNICNKELCFFNTKKQDNSPSLDRKDNEDFLDLNNIQILCNSCNTFKSNMSQDQLIEYCKKIVAKFGHLIEDQTSE